MLYFDRTGVSKGIDVNKTSDSKKFDICHYLYFLDKGFKFHLDVCNSCHDVLMMSKNLSNIAILNINRADYCCIFSRINESGAEYKIFIWLKKALFSHIEIGKEILMFADIIIEKDKFYCYKSPIFIEDYDDYI